MSLCGGSLGSTLAQHLASVELCTTVTPHPISATVHFQEHNMAARFTLVFHVPVAAVEACKAAIFAAGAGRYPGAGKYTECCWTSVGTGQFRPGDGANPHIGAVGALEHVEEARVETLCVGEDVVRKSVEALKKSVSRPRPLDCDQNLLLTQDQGTPIRRTFVLGVPHGGLLTRFLRQLAIRDLIHSTFCLAGADF